MLPILCIGSTAPLFSSFPKQNTQDTLNSNPCFFCTRPSKQVYVGNWYSWSQESRLSLSIFLTAFMQATCYCKFCGDNPTRDSCRYDTLAACQNDYHPQEPWRFEGLRMQESAAEQSATHPRCPFYWSSHNRIEKIRPWARGLRVMRLKTIGRGRGGHPWWAQPLFVMIK